MGTATKNVKPRVEGGMTTAEGRASAMAADTGTAAVAQGVGTGVLGEAVELAVLA